MEDQGKNTDCQYTFVLLVFRFFQFSQVSEFLNKNKNFDTMDKSNMTTRITRGSEKKKNEESVLKNKTKICNGARTRSEEQNIRLEELRLRSEGIGLSCIFGADDDGSDTSMEMLKEEMIVHSKKNLEAIFC